MFRRGDEESGHGVGALFRPRAGIHAADWYLRVFGNARHNEQIYRIYAYARIRAA